MPRDHYSIAPLSDFTKRSVDALIHEINTRLTDITFELSRIQGLDNHTPVFFNPPVIPPAVESDEAAQLSQVVSTNVATTITALWTFVSGIAVGVSTLVSNLNADMVDGLHAISFQRILDRDVTSQDVVNTTTETTVYSFSVPANTLSTNRCLSITLLADYLNNSAGNTAVTVRLKYGATTFATILNAALGLSANRRSFQLTGWLAAANATNAQVGAATAWLSDAVGVAGEAGDAGDKDSMHSTMAEDSTGALTLAITVEHDTADANVSFVSRLVQVSFQ